MKEEPLSPGSISLHSDNSIDSAVQVCMCEGVRDKVWIGQWLPVYI